MDVATQAENALQVISTRLRDRRLQLDYSLRQLAKLSGVSPTGITQIENGERSPTFYSLFLIAAALELPLGELLEDFL